jgi:hypothetical protein
MPCWLPLGINQQLILRALESLEAKHGHHSKSTTRQLIDAIWFEVELLSKNELASELVPRLATRLREIRAVHARVVAAKRRKGRKLKSKSHLEPCRRDPQSGQLTPANTPSRGTFWWQDVVHSCRSGTELT